MKTMYCCSIYTLLSSESNLLVIHRVAQVVSGSNTPFDLVQCGRRPVQFV